MVWDRRKSLPCTCSCLAPPSLLLEGLILKVSNNRFRGSKENYEWDLESEMVKSFLLFFLARIPCPAICHMIKFEFAFCQKNYRPLRSDLIQTPFVRGLQSQISNLNELCSVFLVWIQPVRFINLWQHLYHKTKVTALWESICLGRC